MATWWSTEAIAIPAHGCCHVLIRIGPWYVASATTPTAIDHFSCLWVLYGLAMQRESAQSVARDDVIGRR